MESHWRMTSVPARFFFIDARAAFFVPILAIYPRFITLYIFLGSVAVLSIIERWGYTVPVALRLFRLHASRLFRGYPITIHRSSPLTNWRDQRPL